MLPPVLTITAKQAAAELRDILRERGSAKRAASAQLFFQHEISSHGWRTADLRRFVHGVRKELLAAGDLKLVVATADDLFRGTVMEEKAAAIFLLEQSPARLGEADFHLFCRWLVRVQNWADHDGLVMYLIGPMIAQKPARAAETLRWARRKEVWHRRASAVALIRGLRRGLFWDEAQKVAELLMADTDDMVQKGLGWMLREAAKANPARTLPFLLSLRGRTSRLVLRTACEKLTAAQRERVLHSLP